MGSEKSASAALMTRPAAYSFRTVILFWVRVPVLSEQMTDTLPSPSTAWSFRIMAFSFAIFWVPKDSTMVTMELKASGMAATARATANRNACMGASRRISTLTANKTAQIINIMAERWCPNRSRLTCSGVFFSSVLLSSAAILPISVSMPVSVTRNFARP